MKCKAYIKDSQLTVQFAGASLLFDEMRYPVGQGVTDFSMFPTRIIKSVCEQFRGEFLYSVSKNETDKELYDTLTQYVDGLSSDINPYFNFYMDIYVMYLVCLKKQRKEIGKLLESFLLVRVNTDEIDFTDMEDASKWGAQILIYDLEKRRDLLKGDFDFITNQAENLAELTPMQRLYLLSKQRRIYLSCEFVTTLVPDYQFKPNDNDVEKIKSTLKQNNVDVVEMVTINNLDDLLSFELYHTLKADLQLRKCKYCGEYFIVRGRIDTEYCDRIKEGETKPCCLIGATRSYWGSKTDNPVYAEFQKAYKRNHSRRRVGRMTQTEFYEWSEEAREKREECEAGELSLDEFKVWLGNKR